MNRRDFICAGSALGLLAAAPGIATADGQFNYTPELFQAALDSGEPVLLGFHASWCSTCRTQERQVTALMSENEAYANVQVITANWDDYARSDLVKELRVPRRSTLIMFKGGEEVGRVIAQTSRQAIEELFVAAQA